MSTLLLNMNCCGLKELANVQACWKSGVDDTTAAEQAVLSLVKAYATRKEIHKKTPFGQWVGYSNELHNVRVNPAHVIFSDAHEPKLPRYGAALKGYIEENHLGNVIETPIAHNNNYRNEKHHDIICYVWTPDEDALTAWALARKDHVGLAESDSGESFDQWLLYEWVCNVFNADHPPYKRFEYKLIPFDATEYFPSLDEALARFDQKWANVYGESRKKYISDEEFAKVFGPKANEEKSKAA